MLLCHSLTNTIDSATCKATSAIFDFEYAWIPFNRTKTPMKWRVYAARDRYIVLPECLQPPAAAMAYAPFTPVGFVEDENLPIAVRSVIQSAIDSDFYAVVSEFIARDWPFEDSSS